MTDDPALAEALRNWESLNAFVRIADEARSRALLALARERGSPGTYVRRIVSRLNRLAADAARRRVAEETGTAKRRRGRGR